MRKVRKLRHWKQRFNPNARFMWRRNTTFDATVFEAGTEVPEGLLSRVKIRRFWESKRIELWEFEDPNVATGKIDGKGDELVLPEGVSVEKGKGSWYLIKIVGDEKDYKVNGKKKLAEFIATIPEPETAPGGDTDPGATTSDGGDAKSPLEGAGSDGDQPDDN